jgi:predicted lipoprotein with Yx(FWY)xxD motif
MCAVFAMGAILAGCTESANAPMANRPAMMRPSAIGQILTDDKGMTLYTLKGDENGQSTCYDRCATLWPPLWADANDKPTGNFTITTRKDGTRQWAYNGKPLYLWQRDKQPGDVTGHDYGDVWFVARP